MKIGVAMRTVGIVLGFLGVLILAALAGENGDTFLAVLAGLLGAGLTFGVTYGFAWLINGRKESQRKTGEMG